jgi:hypothetical protein
VVIAKLDFDDDVENALNDGDSEEDIVAEYVESEKVEDDYEAQCLSGVDPVEEKETSLMKSISGYLVDNPCCSKNCCSSWKEDDLQKHAEDMNSLSKTEKKLVLLTILRNSSVKTESTRYS